MKKIRFDTQEFCNGTNYVTLCPYGVVGRFTHEIIMVGSVACERCEYYLGKKDNFVKCNYRYVFYISKNKENF